MSIFDGLSRPMRAAGLGLLAVAVVAALVGGVTLVTGGDDDSNPAAQETFQPDTPGNDGGGQSGSPDGQRPGSGDGSGQGPDGEGSDGNGSGGNGGQDGSGNGGSGDGGSGNGGSGDGGSGDGSGAGDDGTAGGSGGGSGGNPGGNGAENQKVNVKAVDVRVYNNSTISGLARTAGDDMRAQGWNVVEESNYSDGVIPKSTAYFRPGTDEEHAARALASDLGIDVAKRFNGIQDSSPGVVVIVTKDYAKTR